MLCLRNSSILFGNLYLYSLMKMVMLWIMTGQFLTFPIFLNTLFGLSNCYWSFIIKMFIEWQQSLRTCLTCQIYFALLTRFISNQIIVVLWVSFSSQLLVVDLIRFRKRIPFCFQLIRHIGKRAWGLNQIFGDLKVGGDILRP